MDNSYKMILIGGASGVGKSTLIYSIDRQFNFFHFSRKEAFKEMALEELEKKSELYVSGQFLAEKFGVSRNAVWKAINQIRDDGCKIASVNNKGYRLISINEQLSDINISESLSEQSKGLKLIM